MEFNMEDYKQRQRAVTIDRPFAKLAWKIMDFLNGEKAGA
jgi:hypothetical protein